MVNVGKYTSPMDSMGYEIDFCRGALWVADFCRHKDLKICEKPLWKPRQNIVS